MTCWWPSRESVHRDTKVVHDQCLPPRDEIRRALCVLLKYFREEEFDWKFRYLHFIIYHSRDLSSSYFLFETLYEKKGHQKNSTRKISIALFSIFRDISLLWGNKPWTWCKSSISSRDHVVWWTLYCIEIYCTLYIVELSLSGWR